MQGIFDLLASLVELYVVILIVRALLSWVPLRPGTLLARIVSVLNAITEPVLRPVRRLVPPVRTGGAAIDLSVLIVLIVAQVIVIPLLRG